MWNDLLLSRGRCSRIAMTTAVVCRVIGSALVILIGAALALGGAQLWRGGPGSWPDLVANDVTVRRTAGGVLVMAVLVLAAGVAALANMPWGLHAAAIVTAVVVIAAFPVNHVLFGEMRPMHTGTNVVLAAIILALLWFGYDGRAG